MLRLYHVSYLYIPILGFIIAMTVGIVTSLIIGKLFGNFKFIKSKKLKKKIIYFKIIF